MIMPVLLCVSHDNVGREHFLMLRSSGRDYRTRIGKVKGWRRWVVVQFGDSRSAETTKDTKVHEVKAQTAPLPVAEDLHVRVKSAKSFVAVQRGQISRLVLQVRAIQVSTTQVSVSQVSATSIGRTGSEFHRVKEQPGSSACPF